MTERCGACGTDGVTNSMGRFVSRDWLRASELSAECDRLRKIEAAARNLCTVNGRHHSEIAMRALMDACGFERPNV
jgi:hypothetical protein